MSCWWFWHVPYIAGNWWSLHDWSPHGYSWTPTWNPGKNLWHWVANLEILMEKRYFYGYHNFSWWKDCRNSTRGWVAWIWKCDKEWVFWAVNSRNYQWNYFSLFFQVALVFVLKKKIAMSIEDQVFQPIWDNLLKVINY